MCSQRVHREAGAAAQGLGFLASVFRVFHTLGEEGITEGVLGSPVVPGHPATHTLKSLGHLVNCKGALTWH